MGEDGHLPPVTPSGIIHYGPTDAQKAGSREGEFIGRREEMADWKKWGGRKGKKEWEADARN